MTPAGHHRFGGAHAISGKRHDTDTLRLWFERVGRVLPNLHLALDVFEDSQEVARGLAAQAAAGLEEAVAQPIVT